MSVVVLAKNPVIAKLVKPSPEVSQIVTDLLSYAVDGFGSWSGNSTFYNLGTKTFPAGFAKLVESELKKKGYSIRIISKPILKPTGPESPIVDEFGNDNPDYDYQIKALRQIEKHGSGIIRVATGGGKSKIAKLIMARFNTLTLFVTTRGVLLYQMDDQLKDIGMVTGQIGDGKMHAVRGVNLGMVQTLVQSLEVPNLAAERRKIVQSIHTAKNKNANMPEREIQAQAQKKFDYKTRKRSAIIKFLGAVKVVIGEEAHEAGGNSYYEILRHCKSASIRVALTATPFMRDKAEDNLRLMAAFGSVLIDVSEELLIQRGILAKPYFMTCDSPAPPILHRTSPFERAYKLGYKENEFMHADAIHHALMARERSMPVLSLLAHKNHGETIKKVLRANDFNAVFLKGENDMKERRKALDQLVEGRIDGIIGTTILDVGVDVPAIGLLQLLGGMKAQVSLRQRVGRALRRKKTGPNIAFVIDYTCNANLNLRDHWKQRNAILRNIPGFAENVLDVNQELPWELFDTNLAT